MKLLASILILTLTLMEAKCSRGSDSDAAEAEKDKQGEVTNLVFNPVTGAIEPENEPGAVTHIGRLGDDRRVELPMDREAAKKAGGALYPWRRGNETYWSEPKGISMAKAAALADQAAKEILGKDYSGADPRWVMKEAKLTRDSEWGPYYYIFDIHTRDGAYSSKDHLGEDGDVPIVVYFDGTVVKPTEIKEK